MKDSEKQQFKDFLEQSRLLNGCIIEERNHWNTIVSADAIRHFAYGTGDDNPLWIDSDYAGTARYGKQLAPPAFPCSVLYPFLHGASTPLALSSLIVAVDFQWFYPIIEGDRLSAETKQVDVQEIQDRAGRPSAYITSKTSYSNQRGEITAVANGSMVRVLRGESDLLADHDIYRYSEAELVAIKQGISNEIRTGNTQLSLDDVSVGQQIPGIVRGPLTLGDMICWQAAIGPSYGAAKLSYMESKSSPHNFSIHPVLGWPVRTSQQHEDAMLASQRGMPAPFDNALMRFSWICPLVTNWMGDNGFLCRLAIEVLEPVFYGDCVWYSGEVTAIKKRRGGGVAIIQIHGTNQTGSTVTTGRAEVFLPAKQSPIFSLYGPRYTAQNSTVGFSSPLDLISEHFHKRATEPAVICKNQVLSYRELGEKSDCLCRFLAGKGVEPGDIVALRLDRTTDYIIAVISVIKLGAVFLPLESDLPESRVEHIVNDTGVIYGISRSDIPAIMECEQLQWFFVDHILSTQEKREKPYPVSRSGYSTAGYIMYTSATMGIPKAVRVPFSSLLEYFQILLVRFQITEKHQYFHTASFGFSASIRQIFLPLCAGATIILVTETDRLDSKSMLGLLNSTDLSCWDSVPSVIQHYLDVWESEKRKNESFRLNHLTRVLITGEPLQWDLVNKLQRIAPNTEVLNLYSQTETAGTVAIYNIPITQKFSNGLVPLGKPLECNDVLILDDDGNIAANSQIGEICVSANHLPVGYLNQPELSAEKFPLKPGSRDASLRIYRTGDMGRYRSDGILEFRGRRDRRLKIRGFSVDPHEIEIALNKHPAVRRTVLIADTSTQNSIQLHAYIELKGEHDEVVPSNEVKYKDFLGKYLPSYMIPSSISVVTSLPTNAAGKIDFVALSKLSPKETKHASGEIHPKDSLERSIIDIWQEVLKTKNFGKDDDFLAIGGNSLMIMQIQNRVRDTLGVDISVQEFFGASSITLMTKLICKKHQCD